VSNSIIKDLGLCSPPSFNQNRSTLKSADFEMSHLMGSEIAADSESNSSDNNRESFKSGVSWGSLISEKSGIIEEYSKSF
jgi:hypothetical protein